MTFDDMAQVTSRLQELNFGSGVNMSSMQVLDGKVKVLRNVAQYESHVTISHQTCYVTTVIDSAGNIIKSETHCSGKNEDPKASDQFEQLILKLIAECKQISRGNNDSDFEATLRLLNMILGKYRTAGKIDNYDRMDLKFNIFSKYGKIITQLLEQMRREYVRDGQQFYVDNIGYVLSILRVVEMLKKQGKDSSNNYSTIKDVINRMMEAYYNHYDLDSIKNDLNALHVDGTYISVVMTLIQIANEPPPEKPPLPSNEIANDRFETAIQQLITQLQGIGKAEDRQVLLRFFNKVMRDYLANLYILPKFELPDFKWNIAYMEFAEIIKKLFLEMQQQYNRQHDETQIVRLARLTRILELLMTFSKLLPKGQKDNEYTTVANVTVNIILQEHPKGTITERYNSLVKILELLVKLQQLRKEGAPDSGSKTIFKVIFQIMNDLLMESKITDEDYLIETDVSDVNAYKNLIEEIRNFLDNVKDKTHHKEKDEFIIKITTIIQQLKEIRRGKGEPDTGYEKLMQILITILKDYRKNKMLRSYTIEELKFYEVHLKYVDIFNQIIKAMELQYVKQKQHNEVTKLLLITELQKLLVELKKSKEQNERKDELSQIKAILIKIMKDIYDRKRLEENYIRLILQLQVKSDNMNKLIIDLIKLIQNMPENFQPPRGNEDYFENEIRQLSVLLEKLHGEGKPDKGFKATLLLLEYILTEYQNNNKVLPGFKLSDLKLYLVFPEYKEVVYKLIQLMQKQYVQQNQNDQLMKLIHVSQIREFIIRLGIFAENPGNKDGRKDIANILVKIMYDLYDDGRLIENYRKTLLEYQKIYSGYNSLIDEIIKFLRTVPMNERVKEEKGKKVKDIILEVIEELKKNRDLNRVDGHYEELLKFLKRILEQIDANNQKLPSFIVLNLRLEVYLKSGIYDEVLIKLIRNLMAEYSTESKLNEVSILVKLGYLLDWVVELRKLRMNSAVPAGYDTIMNSLIQLINDLSSHGELTKHHLRIWNMLLEKHAEYRTIIIKVIEMLRQNCPGCDSRETTTPKYIPNSSSTISVDADKFEQLVRELREQLDKLYEDGKPKAGYKEINKWMELILKLYQQDRTLPNFNIKDIKLYLTYPDYNQIIDRLIDALVRQYENQGDVKEVDRLKYVIEIRVFLKKIRPGIGDEEQLIEMIRKLIIELWNGNKLREQYIEQLKPFEKIPQYIKVIHEIILYLRNLPARVWVVNVVENNFENKLLKYMEMLKDVQKHRNGGTWATYQEMIKVIQDLLRVYRENNRSLPPRMTIVLDNIYLISLHYSEIWRSVMQAVLEQYRLQGNWGESKRYEFLQQIQWFFRQTIDVGPQMNPIVYQQVLGVFRQIFFDFGTGYLLQNHIWDLMHFVRFSGLVDIVPNVMYYLSNWTPTFTWIGGTPQQIQIIRQIQVTLRQQCPPQTVQYVITIWNRNIGCNCVYSQPTLVFY